MQFYNFFRNLFLKTIEDLLERLECGKKHNKGSFDHRFLGKGILDHLIRARVDAETVTHDNLVQPNNKLSKV